jgi:hypothetical protein
MNSGHVPLEMVDPTGSRKHRAVLDCEHATLCRAFELDQASHFFDLPRSMANAVEFQAAFRSGLHRGREIFGYVFRAGRDKPVGIIRMLPKDGTRPAERFGWDDKINSGRAC